MPLLLRTVVNLTSAQVIAAGAAAATGMATTVSEVKVTVNDEKKEVGKSGSVHPSLTCLSRWLVKTDVVSLANCSKPTTRQFLIDTPYTRFMWWPQVHATLAWCW